MRFWSEPHWTEHDHLLADRNLDEGAEEIYSDGADIVIAAQFGRPLHATSTDGGYRISGRAPFVSNCLDADWISSTVLVNPDEHPDADPEMRMVYFPREQCEIIDTWYVMGMRGTGSNDISVKDVFVPEFQDLPDDAGVRSWLALSGPSLSPSARWRCRDWHSDADARRGAESRRHGEGARPE